MAQARASPKAPQPVRVLIINPDDEVMCGVELADRGACGGKGLGGGEAPGGCTPERARSCAADAGTCDAAPAGAEARGVYGNRSDGEVLARPGAQDLSPDPCADAAAPGSRRAGAGSGPSTLDLSSRA